MVPNSFRAGFKFENTNLWVLHSSPPVEFFKLFKTDDFETKMAEQINIYAVQRGVPRSFKPVSDGFINLYLYINIHRDSGRSPETIFGCSLCKTHPCNELCLAQFHAKIQNIKKEKSHCEVNTLFIWQKSDSANFFHSVIIASVYVIIYQWKGQPFFCLKQFCLIFIQLREEVVIYSLKPSYKKFEWFP